MDDTSKTAEPAMPCLLWRGWRILHLTLTHFLPLCPIPSVLSRGPHLSNRPVAYFQQILIKKI